MGGEGVTIQKNIFFVEILKYMLSIEVLVNNQLLQECFQSVNLKALNSHYPLSVQHVRQKTVSLRKTAGRGFCPIKSISNKDGYHQRFSIFKTSKFF